MDIIFPADVAPDPEKAVASGPGTAGILSGEIDVLSQPAPPFPFGAPQRNKVLKAEVPWFPTEASLTAHH